MRWNLYSRLAGWCLAVGLPHLAASTACRADLVQFELSLNNPVVQSFNGSLAYDALTGNFRCEMTPLNFNAPFIPSGFTLFSGGQTIIDLSVDQNGNFLSSGSGFRLTGTLNLNGVVVEGTDASPLLFGAITAFGAQAPGLPTRDFNGLFDIEGGQLTTVMVPLGGGGSVVPYSVGDVGGFILEAESVTGGTLGNFQSNFSSNSVKSDVGEPTPEPSSWLMSLAGAALLAGVCLYHNRAWQQVPLVAHRFRRAS